ncbi:MAG: hypothetical protein ACM336_01740 [Acidobacteriota bacterium]
MTSLASGTLLSLLAASIGIAGSVFGVSSAAAAPRRIVPLSGALLMGIAIFGVLPEIAEHYGWLLGAAALAAGAGALWLFDRYVYKVCPSCSHTHDHEHCSTALHGFAGPLIVAASLHAFLDGVGISASQQEPAGRLAAAVLFGVTIHKIPEGIALGIMLRASLRPRWAALALCAAAESATLFGAIFESALTAHAGTAWVIYALALAGGSFFYLGFHAVHGAWRSKAAARRALADEL